MTGMKREVARSTSDARWRTEVHLSTGSVLTQYTDWKPSHWAEHADLRGKELSQARRLSESVAAKYGVETTRILQFEESRRVLQVIENYESERLHSEHLTARSDS